MTRVKNISLLLMCALAIISAVWIDAAERKQEAWERIARDETLIIPGVGSNGVILGEDINEIINRFGRRNFRISQPGGTRELFKEVFKVASATKIYFNSIYYNDERKSAACVYHDRVVAVIGFDDKCVTIDSVNMRNGIKSYIFHYGNRNLSVIRGGSNGIYIYPELGIAAFDDGMDDTIDMFIVFPSHGGERE